MGILTRMLKQTAVYWPPGSEASGGSDFDDYGKPLYGAAVEISCRWEDVSVEYIDAQGTNRTSNAIVYTSIDVKPRGVLLLAALASLAGSQLTDPKSNDGAWEIRRFDKLPTLRATKNLRTAYL